jgi:hypothetical protein
MLSPIGGEVDINDATLRDASHLVSDYGDRWLLIVISPEAETNVRNPLGSNLARQWMYGRSGERSASEDAGGAVGQHGTNRFFALGWRSKLGPTDL